MDADLNKIKNKENKAPTSNFVPPPTPLLKKIGFGTGVSVYHLDRSPQNNALRSPWALKTVNKPLIGSQFQKRLEIEAKILQELQHPNIVGFRGFSNTEDGRKMLAMEECTKSLGNIIEELSENGGVRFEPEKIISVIAGVAKALKYLHEEKGLLHGDLKSYNVLIKGDFDMIKLCDFGVSMELKNARVEDYIGTGAWSAPETLQDGPLTEKADIFSLGLVVWEMLVLKVPHFSTDTSYYSGDSCEGSFSSYEEHFGETPELPEGLTQDYALVIDLFKWCTQQDPALRPRARDILDRLVENNYPLTSTPEQITL